MTTYTLGWMTDDVFRQMRGTSRDTYVTLAQSLDAPAALTSETIYFSQSMSGVVSGCLLVQQGETMYVQDTNTLTLSAQVLRGFDDTTPVTASAGQLVTVNPPFTRAIVQDRLKDEIRSWGPQVFQVMTALIPVVQMQRGYDLGTLEGNIIKILRVTAPQPYYDDALDALYQPGTTNTTLRDLDFAFTYNPNANTTEFPSGKSITLTSSSTPAYVGDMNIIYAAAFNVDTSWTETTDMINTVGIDERDLDIAPLGAMARLLRTVSVRRAMLNVQGASRDDQDVTMPAILQAAQQFQLAAQSRLSDVQKRLKSDFPLRSSNF